MKASIALSTDPRTSTADSDCRRWLSCLSHEIRNPLTLIYSSLQILEKEYPCLCESPLWGQTKGDIQFLIRLLKDSSAATREYQPNFTVFPVQELFEELHLSAGPLLDEQHIQFDRQILPNASAHIGADRNLLIKADRTRLKEALMNLLINAADALSSMPDPRERQIHLYADIPDTDSSAIDLHVKDNGPGIPDEYLATLFEPFITHKSNGTGLGLSIVRNIAGLHGGTVSVETATGIEDSFTDFCLSIPFEPRFTPGNLLPESASRMSAFGETAMPAKSL